MKDKTIIAAPQEAASCGPRKCKYCKNDFVPKKINIERGFGLFCSRMCVDEFKRISTKLVRKCLGCGDLFLRPKSKPYSYCSRKCSMKTQVERRKPSSRVMFRVTCDYCGIEIKHYGPSRFRKNKAHFCSMKCSSSASSAKDRPCQHCGKIIHTSQQGKKYCSMACRVQSRKTEKKCPQCGALFIRRIGDAHQKYCSVKCSNDSRIQDRVTVKCYCCGKPLLILKYHANDHSKHFCGKECQNKTGANRRYIPGETKLSDREKSLMSFHYGSRTQSIHTRRITAIVELGKRLLDGRIKPEESETIIQRIGKGETYAAYK